MTAWIILSVRTKATKFLHQIKFPLPLPVIISRENVVEVKYCLALTKVTSTIVDQFYDVFAAKV